MENILQALDIICESRLWKDNPPSYTFRILMYMNSKNWLYTPTKDGKVKAVIGAYRIPEVTDEILNRLPVTEDGTILYVPFVVSLNKNDDIFEVVRETTRKYLKDNSDITEIVLEGKDNKFRRYKIGAENEQGQIATVTDTSNASN